MQDLQKNRPENPIEINKAGVKAVKHPIKIKNKNGELTHATAVFDMYASIANDQRGCHMSRFIEIINQNDWVISISAVYEILEMISNKLESRDSYINIEFDYFINKIAPVSKIKSIVDYKVKYSAEKKLNNSKCLLTVKVPVTTLCPCSKAISKYGAHNQRSEVTVIINSTKDIIIEDLISLIEKQASCEIYSLLKRPDEQYVTEYAYENPKFVEDLTRNIAAKLKGKYRPEKFFVSAENFESIHNHSAYAEISENI